jgi:hypothetical protein
MKIKKKSKIATKRSEPKVMGKSSTFSSTGEPEVSDKPRELTKLPQEQRHINDGRVNHKVGQCFCNISTYSYQRSISAVWKITDHPALNDVGWTLG